jgi:hypothetical protein
MIIEIDGDNTRYACPFAILFGSDTHPPFWFLSLTHQPAASTLLSMYDPERFDGAGKSRTSVKQVLTSIASDVTVGNGARLNAVEVFWTPSAREEVLTRTDMFLDFPELVTL